MERNRLHIKYIFLVVFFSISFFGIKAQNCNGDERIVIVDSIIEIGANSVLSKELDTTLLIRIFYNNLEQNNEYYSANLTNKAHTQYCRLSSSAVDGFWSDYVTIGYIGTTKLLGESINLSKLNFTSGNIKLGIDEKTLMKNLCKKVDCIMLKGNKKVLKYYWIDKNSLDYLAYKIPSYVATFVFEKKKLVKLGFGKYKAELDKEFFPKNYKITKGRIYQ